MKIAVQCPNCGHKDIINANILIMILCCITVIGAIPYFINLIKKEKCPKCECIMQEIINIQTSNIPTNKNKGE